MATGGAVSRYFATLGFKVDKGDIRRIDSHLKLIETKLKTFGTKMGKHLKVSLNIEKFDVDQRKLTTAVGTALDIASTKTVLQVRNFDINQTLLNRQLSEAMMKASRASTVSPKVNPRVSATTGRTTDSIQPRHAVAAGGLGGLAARMYGPALALGLGGYGLGTINRRNQEVISAQLTTQAVVEAAGLGGQGPQAFEWLRAQGNRIGFDYMSQSESYNNFLSNALGAGMDLQGSQDIYLGFAEYARAMGITPARNKLVMNALSQMMGKGTVSMEELKRQMAESMPGTMDVFATAYAEMTKSGKTGQEALADLYKAVPTGKVKSAELLPIVQRILRERAAPKLDIAMKTSQAEQARLQNMMSDMSIVASKSGVESGFARLFRSLTAAMKEAQPAIEGMARAFDEISKYVSFAILLPQSIRRAFEGRDSWVADMIGSSNVQIAKDFYEGLKELGSTIQETLGIAFGGWKLIFETFGDDMLGFISTIKDILLYSFKMLNSVIKGDLASAGRYGEAMQASMMGADAATVKAIAEGKPTPADLAAPTTDTMSMAVDALLARQNLPRPEGLIQALAKPGVEFGYINQYDKARQMAVNDKSSIYYMDPVGFDAQAKDAFNAAMNPNYASPQTESNPVEINVTVQAVPGKEVDASETGNIIAIKIKEALQFFTEK